MEAPFNYQQFQQSVKIDQDMILDHLIEKYLANFGNNRQNLTRKNFAMILEGTFRVSAKVGFSNMSVRDLVKESPISIGRLYHYVDSKETLEDMIVEGLVFIGSAGNRLLDREYIPVETRIQMAVKGGVYYGEMFKPWYYFVFTELNSLSNENMKRARELQITYLERLASLLGNNFQLASDIAVIMQDWYLKKWKYQGVSVDKFAEHCMNVTNILRQNLDTLNDGSVYGEQGPDVDAMRKSLGI